MRFWPRKRDLTDRPPLVTCPICNMTFRSDKAATKAEHGGRVYYFCTETCLRQFEEDPARYARG